MATLDYSHKSVNEKSVDDLEKDTLEWDKILQTCSDELVFLKHFLTSEVFKPINPDTSEKLESYTEELEDLKIEKIEVQLALRNHKNDLKGMLECEDISCDTFYQTQHQELLNRLKDLLANFQRVKLSVFQFSIPILKRKSITSKVSPN